MFRNYCLSSPQIPLTLLKMLLIRIRLILRWLTMIILNYCCEGHPKPTCQQVHFHLIFQCNLRKKKDQRLVSYIQCSNLHLWSTIKASNWNNFLLKSCNLTSYMPAGLTHLYFLNTPHMFKFDRMRQQMKPLSDK